MAAAGEKPGDPPPTPTSIFRDISNYQTPRPNLFRRGGGNHDPSPVFYTASKKTPFSSSAPAAKSSSKIRRPSFARAATRSSRVKAARRLRAFEAEQCQSARKVQVRRDRSLECLARCMSDWINFLFEYPAACGCELVGGGKGAVFRSARASVGDKLVRRDGGFLALRDSLKDVCSLDDLIERMGVYLDSEHQKEVLNSMIQVTKNIDDGRLRMKPHCPIATDVRLKNRAIKILLSYNLTWLKIGLHMVFGGDSLLPAEDGRAGHDDLFLKMVLDKQMFFHGGLAKSYAYNKKVEGLYRPGYFEALGNLILKRFLLLVLLLDKVKSLTALPSSHGIDGSDGGSPLLFDCKFSIKSSKQLIKEFLSEAMHGEGDLIAHLVTLGYKVNHEQAPIVEYKFNVSNLLEDIRDGVRICRVIQLLKCDASVFSILTVPSDSFKKCLGNCNVALTHLKEMGVPLCDEDGVLVIAEDLVNGDRDLTLSLLWNIFVHSQVPLLIDRNLMGAEILRVKIFNGGTYDFSMLSCMNLLLEWTKVVCGQYQLEINEFSSLEGEAIYCVVDYYAKKYPCSISSSQISEVSEEFLPTSDSENLNAIHLLAFIQRITCTLREVLQTSNLFGENVGSNEKSVSIILVFLASQLTGGKKLDQQKLRGICPSRNWRWDLFAPNNRQAIQVNNLQQQAKAALKVQSRFRGWAERRRYLHMKRAALHLQNVVRAWLAYSNPILYSFDLSLLQGKLRASDIFIRYAKFFSERYDYIATKRNVVIVQSYVRGFLARSFYAKMITIHKKEQAHKIRDEAAMTIQSYLRRRSVARKYKLLRQAVIYIQQNFRCFKCRRAFKELNFAAVEFQRLARGQIFRNKMLGSSSFRFRKFKSNHDDNDFELKVVMSSIFKLQKWWRYIFWQKRIRSATLIQSQIRAWIACKKVRQMRALAVCEKERTQASVIVQSQFRRWMAVKNYRELRMWVVYIQRRWRGWLLRRDFCEVKLAVVLIQSRIRGQIARKQLLDMRVDLDKRQKRVVCNYNESATVIQSYFRGWIGRQEALKRRHWIVVIQKYGRGYIARKMTRDLLFDLRDRMVKSAANMENSPKLMERLVSALTELQSMKRVSSILQTCATLDMATDNSLKCCETLVDAGAMNKILQLIRSFNQSTPQLEVSKHLLSTLRNLARYQHLAMALVNTNGSIEIIFFEALRNKGEGYFIAVGILKKLCAMREGLNAIRRLPFFIKRLTSFVEELSRKSTTDKRNARITINAKDYRARQLHEAVELLRIVRN